MVKAQNALNVMINISRICQKTIKYHSMIKIGIMVNLSVSVKINGKVNAS